jgi:hypothetical protein
LSRWTFLHTHFSRRCSAAAIEMGGSRRSIVPSPAQRAKVGARHKARRLQENNVRCLGRTRFEPISSRTGASPSFLRRLQRQPVSSLSFAPLFSTWHGLSSALIGAPPFSDSENVTRTDAACQDKFSTPYGVGKTPAFRRAMAWGRGQPSPKNCASGLGSSNFRVPINNMKMKYVSPAGSRAR